jgi:hypothetical protein
MIKFLGRTHDRELVLDHRDEVRVGTQPPQHLRRDSVPG